MISKQESSHFEFDNEDEVVDWVNCHIEGLSDMGFLICNFKIARGEGYGLNESFSIASREYLELLGVSDE